MKIMRIGWMGEIKDSSKIRSVKDIKTASTLCLTKEEHKHLCRVVDIRKLTMEEMRERIKFARQDAAVKKFKEGYYKARERLAATINKNRYLMELRYALQSGRRQGNDWDKTRPVEKFRRVELKY